MQEVEIPRTRRRLYLGHGHADVTDSYEVYEVTAYLRQDGARLRQFLAFNRHPGLSSPTTSAHGAG
jgi:hypothetical protein